VEVRFDISVIKELID